MMFQFKMEINCKQNLHRTVNNIIFVLKSDDKQFHQDQQTNSNL